MELLSVLEKLNGNGSLKYIRRQGEEYNPCMYTGFEWWLNTEEGVLWCMGLYIRKWCGSVALN